MTEHNGSTLTLKIEPVDFLKVQHSSALVYLLDQYASEPEGGGAGLSEDVKDRLAAELACRPHCFSMLAWNEGEPIGVVNCVEGFSTFACQPLINIHDVYVLPAWRGKGVARMLLAEVERSAGNLNACKLTLEVLSGNEPAKRLYEHLGFRAYRLSPAMGHAVFLQKWLKT